MATIVSTTSIGSEIPIMAPLSALKEGDVQIVGFTVTDIRFPTSLDGVGSDAMHVGTNGSHPYIQLQTNHRGLIGEGIVRLTAGMVLYATSRVA